MSDKLNSVAARLRVDATRDWLFAAMMVAILVFVPAAVLQAAKILPATPVARASLPDKALCEASSEVIEVGDVVMITEELC